MPALSILRFEKIKTVGALVACGKHLARSRPTPNADPTRSNVILIGDSDPSPNAERLLKSLPRAPRADTVLAIEAVLSASPAFFRPDDPTAAGVYDDRRVSEWSDKSSAWLKEKFGAQNIITAVLHLDESTPHIHAVIVPIDDSPRKKGAQRRLNAKRWLGGKEKLAALQDSYAEAVASLGIERGRKGSKANHKDIQHFYREMPARMRSLEAEQQRRGREAAALSAGLGAYLRGDISVAADGLVLFRSPEVKRRLEPLIAEARFGVWVTVTKIQRIIERKTAEIMELLVDERAARQPKLARDCEQRQRVR